MDYLSIYYQNTRGLRTKTEELYNNILLSSYDIIVFTETWLNSNICNSELIDSRYILYRRDRPVSKRNLSLKKL